MRRGQSPVPGNGCGVLTMNRAYRGLAVAGFALTVVGCTQVRGVDPLVNLEATEPVTAESDYIGLIENFTNTYKASRASPDEGALAGAFFIAGSNVVKVRCGLYFRALGKAQQNLDFGAKELTLAGGLTALILGLVDAGSKPTAIAAGSFAFGAATLDNYRQAYLFGPDVSSAHELVRRSMEAYSQQVQTNGVGRYSDAVALLSGYERLCEAHEIRRLVNESVEKAEPITEKDKDKDKDKDGQKNGPAPRAAVPGPTRSYSVGVSIR